MEFKTKVKLGIAAAFAVVLLVIIFRNTQNVRVEILFMTIEMPLIALLLTTLVIGIALGWLTSALLRRRKANQA